MTLRQRLDREHVEHGAGEPAGIERGDQGGLDEVAAARGVDHHGTPGQRGERGAIQDPGGGRRERQQADQKVRAFQELAQVVAAGKAALACN